MMTAWMSDRFKRSAQLLPDPESSEYRSRWLSTARLWADSKDLEYTAFKVKSFDARTAGYSKGSDWSKGMLKCAC